MNNKKCSRCEKELKETKPIVTGYWKCDDCMTIDMKTSLDKSSQVKLKFLNKSTAEQIIKSLRELVNKNGSLSLNELDKILANYDGK